MCRSSYIDPKVLDRFRDGKTIDLPRLPSKGHVGTRQRTQIERQVRELIGP